MTLTLVLTWSAPDSVLLKQSYGTLYVTQYQGNNALTVIDAKTIVSVVGMVPMPSQNEVEQPPETESPPFFLVKRPGLQVYELVGIREDDSDEDDEDDVE